MSDWTHREVEAIEEGGNQRAAIKWLAKWKDSQFPEPDNTEPDRVRDFIRQKYVERRWLGRGQIDIENGASKPNVPSRTAPASPASATSPAESATQGSIDGDGFEPPSRPLRRATVASVSTAAPTAVPAAAASAWTADFSDAAVAPATSVSAAAPAPVADPGTQWVADFGAQAAPAPSVAAATAPVVPAASATCPSNGAGHGINPCLLGLDFSDAQPAKPAAIIAASEDDAATAARMAPVLAAAAEAAAEKAARTPGDELRDAVLNGRQSCDAVRRLYEDSLQRPGAPRPPMPADVAPAQPLVAKGPTTFYIGDDSPKDVTGTAPSTHANSGGAAPQAIKNDCAAEDHRASAPMQIFDDDDLNDLSPPREFDDLIQAFQDKNPVLGFDF